MSLHNRTAVTPQATASPARERNRGGANAVLLLLGAGMLAMFYLLTLYMQVVRGYSAVHTSLAYLPFVAGVGALIFAAGAVVAICTVNARISAAEAAAH